METVAHSQPQGKKYRSTAARSGPGRKDGPPAFASAQAMKVLDILRRAGSTGVSRERFLTPSHLGGFGITQVGARIIELAEAGFIFEHRRPIHPQKYVTYILRSEPMEALKPFPLLEQRTNRLPAKQEAAEVQAAQEKLFDTRSFVNYETGRF